MKFPRPCIDCGRVGQGTRCPECQRARYKKQDLDRGPRKHYGGDYPRRARAVREAATHCWLCGEGPRADDPWQADHLLAGAPHSPLLPAHRSCNIRRGNRPIGEDGIPPEWVRT